MYWDSVTSRALLTYVSLILSDSMLGSPVPCTFQSFMYFNVSYSKNESHFVRYQLRVTNATKGYMTAVKYLALIHFENRVLSFCKVGLDPIPNWECE